jgi:chemotaxis response regulator CheB
MNKLCFLAIQKNSLFKQAVSSLIGKATNGIELYESEADNVEGLIKEILDMAPHVLVLEESSPLLNESVLAGLLMISPYVSVIVVSEETSFMHVVHRETIQLSSSIDLIEAINPNLKLLATPG